MWYSLQYPLYFSSLKPAWTRYFIACTILAGTSLDSHCRF